MNICGCGGLQKEELRFNEIGIKSEEGMLNFDNSKGVFVFENTKKINEKKKELEELEKQREKAEKEKRDFEKKIGILDQKLKDMEKILMIDMKENLYIKNIGEKTKRLRDANKFL